MEKNLEGLYCSLLHQLLSTSAVALGKIISVSTPASKRTHTDWSSEELLSALISTLETFEDGVCLFLDGLDEIDPEDGTKDGIPELLDLTLKLAQSTKIKIFLASRPTPYILEQRLSTYPRLRLQDLNYQDLMVWAQAHLHIPAM